MSDVNEYPVKTYSSELNDAVEDASTLLGILEASSEACWSMEFTTPVNLNVPKQEVVRQVFENSPYWRFCNKAMAMLYRFPLDQDFNQCQVSEIFPCNERNRDFVRLLIKNDFHVNQVSALDTRYDGEEIHVENDVRAHIRGGFLIRMFGMVRNISKQQRREQELREQIGFLKGVLDSISDPILAVSSNGNIVAANTAVANFYDKPLDRILGYSVFTLWHAPASLKNQINRCLNSKRALSETFSEGCPDGMASYSTSRVLIEQNKDLVLIQLFGVHRADQPKAKSNKRSKSFGVLAEAEIRIDFEVQRALSSDLERILKRGERAVSQGIRILITGESGVGKTELARHLHNFVAGSGDPFMSVNCASIPENLFESELFGYGRGAFTGADSNGRKGLIEQAEEGTLFLDEVGEMPLTVQAKLLSFLEDGIVQPIGGVRRSVTVRVISATNRNLYQMVMEGTFRADLYYRLSVVSLDVPSLRDMPELLDYLTRSFVDRVNLRRKIPLVLERWVMQRIQHYSYPGNIRELFNIIQQLSIFVDESEDLVGIVNDILPMSSPVANETVSIAVGEEGGLMKLKDQVKQFEHHIISNAIAKHGSKRKAALALGVDIGTIVRKTKNAGKS
ncbi:sigma 54-interacting transcriptional regulator [Marinomonas sp.]|uniref:sigma 54-interacting transcriptional regulator n=1 Tax=Marinomonas sp. TaxID=1904862 RepID=UPI003BA9A958